MRFNGGMCLITIVVFSFHNCFASFPTCCQDTAFLIYLTFCNVINKIGKKQRLPRRL